MKKLLFGFAALALLATSSCKKDDEASGPSNKITVEGETLAVSSFSTSGSTVAVTAGSTSTSATIVSFNFGTGSAAPSNGTYKVVSIADAADEVDIDVARTGSGTGALYSSEDGSNVVVTVGKDGDKMTVTMPELSVKQSLGGTGSIKVSANAKQL